VLSYIANLPCFKSQIAFGVCVDADVGEEDDAAHNPESSVPGRRNSNTTFTIYWCERARQMETVPQLCFVGHCLLKSVFYDVFCVSFYYLSLRHPQHGPGNTADDETQLNYADKLKNEEETLSGVCTRHEVAVTDG